MSGFDLRVIDAILALIVLEGLGLIAWRSFTGSGPRTGPLIANLAAGAALLTALRETLSGAPAALIGATLALALVAHGLDLAGRWSWRKSFTPPAGM